VPVVISDAMDEWGEAQWSVKVGIPSDETRIGRREDDVPCVLRVESSVEYQSMVSKLRGGARLFCRPLRTPTQGVSNTWFTLPPIKHKLELGWLFVGACPRTAVAGCPASPIPQPFFPSSWLR
jgi:hypothetical protein